jgi:hypothetical protein
MTEAEWRACTDPETMLEFLRGKVSDRKLRLFACACCRRIWTLLTDQRSREAVEVAERYADRAADEKERDAAFGNAYEAVDAAEKTNFGSDTCYAAHAAYHAIKTCFPADQFDDDDADDDELCPARDAAAKAGDAACFTDQEWGKTQSDLLRDIFGNPFRPVLIEFGNPFHPATVDPSWLTPAVVVLAKTIYDERAFARLPVLADALEEAGCNNADILAHCRQPGEHVLGCWVVDLMLGKE